MQRITDECWRGVFPQSDNFRGPVQADPTKTISILLGSADTIEGSRYPGSIKIQSRHLGKYQPGAVGIRKIFRLHSEKLKVKTEGGPGSPLPGRSSNRDTDFPRSLPQPCTELLTGGNEVGGKGPCVTRESNGARSHTKGTPGTG